MAPFFSCLMMYCHAWSTVFFTFFLLFPLCSITFSYDHASLYPYSLYSININGNKQNNHNKQSHTQVNMKTTGLQHEPNFVGTPCNMSLYGQCSLTPYCDHARGCPRQQCDGNCSWLDQRYKLLSPYLFISYSSVLDAMPDAYVVNMEIGDGLFDSISSFSLIFSLILPLTVCTSSCTWTTKWPPMLQMYERIPTWLMGMFDERREGRSVRVFREGWRSEKGAIRGVTILSSDSTPLDSHKEPSSQEDTLRDSTIPPCSTTSLG